MKASEGKPGRVFFLRLEEGDSLASVQRFAEEKGIAAGEAVVMGDPTVCAVIAPDADGRPEVRFPVSRMAWSGVDVVVREFLLTRVAASKTRVFANPAPAPEPEEVGAGTVPVYLFNAEFN